jgi:hypothetical protein
MPQPLREFSAEDWQEWLLGGPDPAQEGRAIPLAEHYAMPHPVQMGGWYVDGVEHMRTVVVGIGDDPERVARDRHDDAYKRWTEARRGWLTEHMSVEAGLDFWIDATAERYRARQVGRRPAMPRQGRKASG